MKKFENGSYKALVCFNEYSGKWEVTFYCFGSIDFDVRGTYRTGVKGYESESKAIAAAKRYINKF